MKRLIENDMWGPDAIGLQEKIDAFIGPLMAEYPDHSLYDLRMIIDDTISMRVTYEAAKRAINKRVEDKALANQNPLIWGKGWYAIYSNEDDGWWLAHKEYFDENGCCPDGWDWGVPEGMSDDELEEFINEHGCEPKVPKEFQYTMESFIRCYEDWNVDKQKAVLGDFGFIVNDVPPWSYERNKC